MELVVDVETTTKEKGNPFVIDNKLCLVGTYDGKEFKDYDFEYTSTPYGHFVEELVPKFKDFVSTFIGFNAKFDLHWLNRYGMDYNGLVWDCQLAHFILSNMIERYPSLNSVAAYWGLGQKIDRIAEYWEQGLDTPNIPLEELQEYLRMDLELTYKIYLKQKEAFEQSPLKFKLFKLQSIDLQILKEMEWNGIKFDEAKAKEKLAEIERTLFTIKEELDSFCPDVSINWTSNDQLSAFLFGGSIKERFRERYERVLKGGRIKIQERWSVREIILPRQVKPIKGSEAAKEGYYSVDKKVLFSLKANKRIKHLIDLVLEYKDLEHLKNTYYLGLQEKIDNTSKDGIIHGVFNQVVAATGRLSSSNPNLQNFDERVRECLISRF